MYVDTHGLYDYFQLKESEACLICKFNVRESYKKKDYGKGKEKNVTQGPKHLFL